MSCILAHQGALPRVSGMFYKAVVQAVLLYGSESWVVTSSMLCHLSIFYHQITHQISGLKARYHPSTIEWIAAPLLQALETTGLFFLETYISRRQATVVQYMATCPLFQAATDYFHCTGSTYQYSLWWDQNV